ncbi:type II toxin-antitoxin system PemK/MazF family toxin [Sulfurimonas sp. SAG-AH-194-I05]|nr:type II toxin-antitoxin system PemK/MazF family toxin [Sulfurimonas sp. SAG-AH-194-I05]MDF1874220.1 type II toxin-antitoxin system PemK/MazF family toxin [Sulfurimonas sp. SAG-AH-194-I05]
MNVDPIEEFDKWNTIKKEISPKNTFTFKVREVYWLKLGQNIGYETNGKGHEFLRPVLVFRKFSKDTFLGIPLTTSIKDDMFHYKFMVNNSTRINYAILSQMKLFDISRVKSKLGKISVEDFKNLKLQMKDLLELN